MHKLSIVPIVLYATSLLAFAPSSSLAQTVSNTSTPMAQRLHAARWLTGCWELTNGPRTTHEQWMAPHGGVMLGMSRTVVRDTTREFEHLRIDARAATTEYIAQPSGQTLTTFPATLLSDTLLVFSNPAHDFPQSIRYRRIGADSIVARIEGNRNGQLRGIDFPMRRVGCENKERSGTTSHKI